MTAISPPKLIDTICLSSILFTGLEADYFSRLDQAFPLQYAKDGALRYIPAFIIDEL